MVQKQNNLHILESTDNLDDIIDNNKCYVLYFTASWCGPCKRIAPHVEMLSNNYNIEFYKIDIDECEEVTQQFDIISVPTFIFMKKQKEIFSKCEGSKVDILKSRVDKTIHFDYCSKEQIELMYKKFI